MKVNHLKFQGDFVIKAKALAASTEQPAERLKSWFSGAGYVDKITLAHNKPRKGDLTVQVRVADPVVRRELHGRIFQAIDQLGLPARFAPEKPITRAEREQFAVELAGHLKTAMAAIQARENAGTTGETPNTREPKVRVNGEHLQIVVWDHAEMHAVTRAVGKLNEAGIVQKGQTPKVFGMSSECLKYQQHQLDIVWDTNSPFYPKIHD